MWSEHCYAAVERLDGRWLLVAYVDCEANVDDRGEIVVGEAVEEEAAFMVVFGDRNPLPAIAKSHREPFGDPLELEDLKVPVIVVPFEGVAPSKALREKKARTRSGR